jgi:hypothetical protein
MEFDSTCVIQEAYIVNVCIFYSSHYICTSEFRSQRLQVVPSCMSRLSSECTGFLVDSMPFEKTGPDSIFSTFELGCALNGEKFPFPDPECGWYSDKWESKLE